MIEAIYKAHEVNQTIIEFIDKIVAEAQSQVDAFMATNK